jgi:hypothetical protein
MNILRRCITLALVLSALPAIAQNRSLPEPKGRAVLTVSGKIAVKNRGETAAFDMAMIEALPQHSFTTRTPWYDRPVKFTGPLLSDVLDAVQASGGTISAVAINDYKISIPADDARKFKVVMARQIDDKPISVRDKGPLFIVYPFDSAAELRSSTYYERSIWQLKAMEIQ